MLEIRTTLKCKETESKHINCQEYHQTSSQKIIALQQLEKKKKND